MATHVEQDWGTAFFLPSAVERALQQRLVWQVRAGYCKHSSILFASIQCSKRLGNGGAG